MPLTIRRMVTVKAVVTEELKHRLGAELQSALARLDNELAQLEGQGAGVKPGDGEVPDRRRYLQQREQLLARLKELARLEPGSEIVEGTVEGQVEVRPGDEWQRLFSAEIVLRDGKVIAVRE